MKKKHKTGYRTGNDVKTPFPLPIKKPFPNGKPPILWVKKGDKLVKATDEDIKTASKASKRKSPKKIMVGGKYVKKGGKV
mgnify:CR=1 FL=1|tara:strand:+ start:239 stop:478 length:240 start_codon:yes stop_codon:yes gene_type:complete